MDYRARSGFDVQAPVPGRATVIFIRPGNKALSATASAASSLTIRLSGAAAAPAVVRERREIRPPQHAAGREPAGAKRRARRDAGLSFLSRTPGSYGCDESACASPTMTFAP